MAWRVVDCEMKIYPWDGYTEGWVYWALLEDDKTGKELEFEMLDGVYYGGEEEEEREEPWELIEVIINGVLDFSEIFPKEERRSVLRELRRRYGDIIDAINKECDEFKIKLR
jgi:hypothetical protein